MNFVKNLSIKSKLLLIGLIPILALLYFLSVHLMTQFEARKDINQVHKEVVRIEHMSQVIHQLQNERFASLEFILGDERIEGARLNNQRAKSDAVINEFLDNVELSGEERETADRFLGTINLIRNTVSSHTANIDTIQRFYKVINEALIFNAQQTVLELRNPEVRKPLMGHLDLMFSKEFFGQARNELSQNIREGRFTERELSNYVSTLGKYRLKADNFVRTTTPEIAGFYKKQTDNELTAKTMSTLNEAAMDFELGNRDYNVDEWLASSTSFLNILKNVEDRSSKAIRQLADEQLTIVNNGIISGILIAVVFLILIAIFLHYLINLLTTSFHKIKTAADRIALGDLDLNLDISSKDEIGSVADSFNRMINLTRDYVVSAQNIGKGNYNLNIPVRSNADKLGMALNQMQKDLKEFSEDNENRTWLLTGTGKLNDTIRGEKEIHELSQGIINFLASYLEAQIGALYLVENGALQMYGSYAYNFNDGQAPTIQFGEGLVGQAAKEKKTIVFSKIPDNYLTINSGLGKTKPKHIIVFPFFHEGELKGLVELGTAEEFTPLEQELLELIGENIAIAFHSNQSRTQTKELLEETQRQAEELEAQQEELRQTNEELHTKTTALEDSEMELRAQQIELQQTNEELEEKATLLAEQKAKLELAKVDVENKAKELELTSKYKSEFLANMSHELRTPLNSILILAEILADNRGQNLTDKDVEFVKNIHSSGNDLLNLINEILDLSKVEAGKIELEPEAVELEAVIKKIYSLFKEQSLRDSINFKINFDEKDFETSVITDKLRLEQILKNLLSNAFKFTPKEGSVSLDLEIIRSSGNYFSKKLNSDPKILSFKVTDTGIGIAKEKQALVFEAFQQADGSTKRKFGGTGLGLSISREIAGKLGGEIHLESEEGKGSTFTLYLPLDCQVQEEIPATADELVEELIESSLETIETPVHDLIVDIDDDRHKIKPTDKVVLVIEDDVPFANILLKFVREKGYKGILAHQGDVGLSLARHYQPDAVLLDIKLPVMDGTEVLKKIKTDPDLRHIPVQIISGFDKRKEGVELGAFDFLKKPISQKDLTSSFGRVEEFLNKKLKKLLIVEDNVQHNQAIKELIGNGDVHSFPAFSGQEAQEMLTKEDFDCIILDLGLPDMTGIELMEKIKADEKLRKTPIIVYTAKDLSKEEALQLESLANTVVLKTVDSHERLLDETSLFLHRVESKLPVEKQQIIRKLHRSDEILQGKKILVVDDDYRNIFSLTNALENEGLTCITAENGKVALDVLAQNPDIDLILMDVMMPEMDGYEATREIRKLTEYENMPIIALTAKAMKGDREKCLLAGMSDYVSKPVNVNQLISLLRVWLYK
jgi:CheY-like chemotaxis protein/HAMP domain-containing protein/putative methionine-R-sulfoxide reductase with GAF domain